MKLCIFFMAVMMGAASAETLNRWSAEPVKRDEQSLPDALAQRHGRTLDLIYRPLFFAALEPSKETKPSASSPTMPKAVKWILIVSGVSPLLAGLARLLQLKLKAKGS